MAWGAASNLAVAGGFFSATGSVLSGLNSYYTAKAQSKLLLSQAKSQEAVAEKNIASVHKNSALQLKILEQTRLSAEAETASAVASAGIMQNSQTAQEVQRRNDEEIAFQKWQVRQQAIEQTVQLQTESRLNTIGLQTQAKLAKATGKANMVSSMFGAAGSLFGSAAQASAFAK